MKSKRIVQLAAAAILLSVVCLTGAGGFPQTLKPPPPGDTKVTSILADSGEVVLSTNFRVQSDGRGEYKTLKDGDDSVSSVIQGSDCCKDWVLDTSSSTTRSVLVDFRDPVPPTTVSTAPFNWDFVHARLIVKCHLVLSGGFPAISLGSTLNCPMLVRLPNTSKSFYRIEMDPLTNQDTNWVRVTCTRANAAGTCTSWTIQPWVQADGSLKSIGKLLLVSTKGSTPPQDKGNFFMTFSITVTNP